MATEAEGTKSQETQENVNESTGSSSGAQTFVTDDPIEEFSMKNLGIRLLYTIFFLIIFSIMETVIQVSIVFQFVYMFFAHKPNDSVRNFTNRATSYVYQILRYVTMNTNERPFPFADLPKELEPAGAGKLSV